MTTLEIFIAALSALLVSFLINKPDKKINNEMSKLNDTIKEIEQLNKNLDVIVKKKSLGKVNLPTITIHGNKLPANTITPSLIQYIVDAEFIELIGTYYRGFPVSKNLAHLYLFNSLLYESKNRETRIKCSIILRSHRHAAIDKRKELNKKLFKVGSAQVNSVKPLITNFDFGERAVRPKTYDFSTEFKNLVAAI